MPERVRLNPYLTIVVRPPTLVQLGASTSGAPVLQPPPWLAPDATTTLLRWLQSYRSLDDITAHAADSGLTAGDVSELLDALRAHDLLEDEPAPSPLHVYLHGRGAVTAALLDELSACEGVRVSAGTARSWTPDGRGVDLAVLTDTLAPDPVLVARLMRARLPHLTVQLRDGIGHVGPLVLPGAGPCLRCLDHFRAECDPGWPTIACQLFGRTGRGSAHVLRITAAVAAAQIDTVSAGRWNAIGPPETLGCTLEIESCGITIREWPMHPNCGCGFGTVAAG